MKRTIPLFLFFFFFIFLLSPLQGREENSTVRVTVRGVTLDPFTSKPVVLLEDPQHKKVLPIWIGSYEANAIALGLKHISPPRPMTHDLLKNILDELEMRVNKVVITDLRDEVFYSVILFDINSSQVSVDSRPSDAIALALKTNAPIFVVRDVMDKAESISLKTENPIKDILLHYGLTVQELTPAIAVHFDLTSPKGVLISGVRSGSQAETAGLQRGDIIRKIGKERVLTLSDVYRTVKKEKKGFLLINIEREKAFHSFTLKSK